MELKKYMTTLIKKYLVPVAVAAGILGVVGIAGAQIEITDNITVALSDPDIELTIQALDEDMELTSVTVNDGSIDVTIPAGTRLIVTSEDRDLEVTGDSVQDKITCSSEGVTRLFIYKPGVSKTVTITPKDEECSSIGGGGGDGDEDEDVDEDEDEDGGGGGGGGGRGAPPAPAPAPAAPGAPAPSGGLPYPNPTTPDQIRANITHLQTTLLSLLQQLLALLQGQL